MIALCLVSKCRNYYVGALVWRKTLRINDDEWDTKFQRILIESHGDFPLPLASNRLVKLCT